MKSIKSAQAIALVIGAKSLLIDIIFLFLRKPDFNLYFLFFNSIVLMGLGFMPRYEQ